MKEEDEKEKVLDSMMKECVVNSEVIEEEAVNLSGDIREGCSKKVMLTRNLVTCLVWTRGESLSYRRKSTHKSEREEITWCV